MNWLSRRDYDKNNDLFSSFRKRVNSLFDDFLSDSPVSMKNFDFEPTVDIDEDEKNIYVKADLPGMNEKDIDISINNNVLTIKGERSEEDEDKDKNKHRIERRYGYFERSFSLPEHVVTDKAKAKYKNGVLKLEIPKDEKKAKSKKISIEAK